MKGKRIFWSGGYNGLNTGIVEKETPKTYKVTQATDCRSMIYKDEVRTLEELSNLHLQGLEDKVSYAKEDLIKAIKRVKDYKNGDFSHLSSY